MFLFSSLEIFYSKNHQQSNFSRNSPVLQCNNHCIPLFERSSFYSLFIVCQATLQVCSCTVYQCVLLYVVFV